MARRLSPTSDAVIVGVISDTHGLLRPEAVHALRCVDLIVHAGDVGKPEVLEALAAIAPVHAVRGNNDRGAWARALPEQTVVRAGAARLLVIHDVHELDDGAPGGVHAVISGHSHKPSIERRGGVLYLNPGSAGPRRFSLPIALARLRVCGEHLSARIKELG
jgi:putative phosphoesterase